MIKTFFFFLAGTPNSTWSVSASYEAEAASFWHPLHFLESFAVDRVNDSDNGAVDRVSNNDKYNVEVGDSHVNEVDKNVAETDGSDKTEADSEHTTT